MKKPFVYAILFGIPGFVASLILSFVCFGVSIGFAWLYVYGDNPWPRFAEKILPALFIAVFALVWFLSITAGFVTGKRLEGTPGLDRKHILVSAILTALFAAIIFLHQVRVGNIGKQPDSILCSDFCSARGYAASMMPPKNSGARTCSCLDSRGREILQVPFDTVISAQQN